MSLYSIGLCIPMVSIVGGLEDSLLGVIVVYSIKAFALNPPNNILPSLSLYSIGAYLTLLYDTYRIKSICFIR